MVGTRLGGRVRTHGPVLHPPQDRTGRRQPLRRVDPAIDRPLAYRTPSLRSVGAARRRCDIDSLAALVHMHAFPRTTSTAGKTARSN